ncbi:unnamed protein product [Cuscuta campestris]|uniref:Cysteine-rich transmembrane domain-containing protein n=1 Tax=Cuscuta campestris TaxID=132261 RepID=A0A484N356_9ASTE|nr:unnamed protein product [Cuscuta campestris]
MSNYAENKVYPPPATGYPSEPRGSYMVRPPPVGYPMKDGNQSQAPATATTTTQARGDGFWKGCFAALCCCCLCEACF